MKFKHGIRASLVLLLLAILLATSASAEIIKHLEFDTDGELAILFHPEDVEAVVEKARAALVKQLRETLGGIRVYEGSATT